MRVLCRGFRGGLWAGFVVEGVKAGVWGGTARTDVELTRTSVDRAHRGNRAPAPQQAHGFAQAVIGRSPRCSEGGNLRKNSERVPGLL